ncbi:chorismate mutase [Streptomyces sp. NBC_01244]|uniref:chorismate mutase n=1 Tax=Streptomyces sp. NBC_01244 TaxID=2903797 RepID=UPI002E10793A|nr:chorismate mutase [Streptomyces sp. NBC_01244]
MSVDMSPISGTSLLTGVRSDAGNAARAVQAVLAHRSDIDEVDRRLISLIKERIQISSRVQKARMGAGGPRIVYYREEQILGTYERELGSSGEAIARVLLELGRGQD